VGPFNAGSNGIGEGLAYDAALGMYVTDTHLSGAVDDQLFKVNPATGAATLIGAINGGNALGLTFIPEPAAATLMLGLGFCASAMRRRRP